MGERDSDSATINGNGQQPPQVERRKMPRPGDKTPEPDQWRGDSRQTVRRDSTADDDGGTPASGRTPIPS